MSVFTRRVLTTTKNFTLRGSLTAQVNSNSDFWDNDAHPLHRHVHELWAGRKNQLNITAVTTKAGISKLAVIRHRCRRRLVEAARLALHEHGYKADGKPLEKGSDRKPLTGSLVFFPETETLHTDWPVLCEEVKSGVVKFLEWKAKEERAPMRQQFTPGTGSGAGKDGKPQYRKPAQPSTSSGGSRIRRPISNNKK